jgi:hypothetical protein
MAFCLELVSLCNKTFSFHSNVDELKPNKKTEKWTKRIQFVMQIVKNSEFYVECLYIAHPAICWWFVMNCGVEKVLVTACNTLLKNSSHKLLVGT